MTKLTRFIDAWHNIIEDISFEDFYEWSYNTFESHKLIYDSWSTSLNDHYDYDPRTALWSKRQLDLF